MADNYRSANEQDELDLLHLLEKLISFFRTHGKLLMITSFTGLLCGYLIYKMLPKSYQTNILLHSTILNNSEEIAIIDNWNELMKKGGRKVLANDFGCTPDVLKSLFSIKAKEIEKLTGQNTIGFQVEMQIKDTLMADLLSRGLVYGLENSDYVKERVKVRKANLTEVVNMVKNEITKLDSTKASIEKSIAGKKNGTSSFIVDVSGINAQMIGLNEKLLQYRENLHFSNAIQVLQVTTLKVPISPSRFNLLFAGLVGGFGIGFLSTLYQRIKRRLAINRLSAKSEI